MCLWLETVFHLLDVKTRFCVHLTCSQWSCPHADLCPVFARMSFSGRWQNIATPFSRAPQRWTVFWFLTQGRFLQKVGRIYPAEGSHGTLWPQLRAFIWHCGIGVREGAQEHEPCSYGRRWAGMHEACLNLLFHSDLYNEQRDSLRHL